MLGVGSRNPARNRPRSTTTRGSVDPTRSHCDPAALRSLPAETIPAPQSSRGVRQNFTARQGQLIVQPTATSHRRRYRPTTYVPSDSWPRKTRQQLAPQTEDTEDRPALAALREESPTHSASHQWLQCTTRQLRLPLLHSRQACRSSQCSITPQRNESK